MNKIKKSYLFKSNIVITNKLEEDIYLVIKSDPNAMKIQKVSLQANVAGGGLGGERTRDIPVESRLTVKAGESHNWSPPSKMMFVSAFVKKDDHYGVLFLNLQADRGKEYEVVSNVTNEEVTDMRTMQEWQEVIVPAAMEMPVDVDLAALSIACIYDDIKKTLTGTHANKKPRKALVDNEIPSIFAKHNKVLTDEIKEALNGLNAAQLREIEKNLTI